MTTQHINQAKTICDYLKDSTPKLLFSNDKVIKLTNTQRVYILKILKVYSNTSSSYPVYKGDFEKLKIKIKKINIESRWHSPRKEKYFLSKENKSLLNKITKLIDQIREEKPNQPLKLQRSNTFFQLPEKLTSFVSSNKLQKFNSKLSLKDHRHAIRKIRDHSQVPEKYQKKGNLFMMMNAPVNVVVDKMEMKFVKLNPEHFIVTTDKKLLKKVLNKNCYHISHGINGNKQGGRRMLNIMIEGIVKARWTGFINNVNDPSISAGPHGPFYLIFNKHKKKQYEKTDQRALHFIYPETLIEAYLVPDEEYRTFYLEGLKKAVELKFITENEMDRISKRIIVFKEFINMSKKAMKRTSIFKKEVQKIQEKRA